MQVIEIKKGDLDFHVKVIISAKNILEIMEKELKNIAKTAKLPGFRVGKVPPNILAKKYESTLRNDAIQKEVSHAVDHIIKDNKLNVAAEPKIEDFSAQEGKDIEFVLKCELLPEISLPDFSKILIEKPNLVVDQKAIDEHINKLMEFSKTYNAETDKPASKGDQVTINAIGYVDGKAFDGGKVENYKLVLGSKSFIDSFEDQLIGAKAGDEITVKVTFPENYHMKEVAAKPAEFNVKVLAVHKPELQELNDEFAKKFNCDNVGKLIEQVAKNVKSNFDEPINTIMKMSLFDQLEKLLSFNVPKSLLTQESQSLKTQTANDENSLFEDKSEEERDQYYNKLSLRRVRIGLLLSEYIAEKKLAIEEIDIRNAIIARARSFPGQEKQVFEFYQKNKQAVQSLRGEIIESKAVEYIFKNEVTLMEKNYTIEEFTEFLKKEDDREIVI